MGRKSAGLVGIVAAVLALGLGATIETGHAQGHSAGVRVVADDRGPTVITSHASFASAATPADDRGPTVIAAHASSVSASVATPADDRGPTSFAL
ncbi:hypothetical protein [Streptomyces sp. NPDC058954]|uniref:hypothetical protein n=1 Tax=Streptomyces sp. NPDC058954 TaxID=3346677 RepID=UPI0036BFD325